MYSAAAANLELPAGLGHSVRADPGKQGYARREKTVSLNHGGSLRVDVRHLLDEPPLRPGKAPDVA